MMKHHNLRFTAAVAFVALLWGSAAQAEPAKPNIVLILADDLRADCIGALGNPHIQTPNIDRLVNHGVAFRNCFIMGSNSPAVCMPSRTMLMSGRSLYHLPADIRANGNQPSVPVMPTVLKAAGYETFNYSKDGNDYRPANRAFDYSYFYPGFSKKPWTWKQSDEYADKTIEFLRDPKRGQRPFFICLAPAVPHDPVIPNPADLARYAGDKRPPLPPNVATNHAALAGFNLIDTNCRTYDVPGLEPGKFRTPLQAEQYRDMLAHYYALVTTFDTAVGRILDELDRTGAARNTIVVFTSDNGHSHGDHGLIHKQSIYDHDNKVPLIIRGPGMPAGQVRDTYVYLSDLFPTMCEWAGTPIPPTVETKSFAASITDAAKPHRQAVYTAYTTESRAYRDEEYKLILYNVTGTQARYTQLFHIKDDPFEQRNLAGDPAQAERVSGMIAHAREAGRELGEDGPDCSPGLKFWMTWDQRHPFGPSDVQLRSPRTKTPKAKR
ncbi:MAG: sulfatase-like hydrolase/transferase [Planctomycetia bacterium]|nr:sulfatase-like hydrolase/transferase [Planctomycetia bacterium]